MARSYITAEDVRLFVLDREPSDNERHKDLVFSDEEIHAAMERAAREYRSIPPLIGTGIEADCLPTDTNMFFDAIAEQLYKAHCSRLMRNDIDYDAGGVTTNLVKKEIEHLMNLAAMHRESFRQAARDQKVAVNLRNAYGPIG